MTEPTPTSGESGSEDPATRPARYLKSTIKHGLIYFMGNVLSRLVGFIMLPVYTRILTTRDYGVLEILSVSGDVLGMLAGMGIRQAVMRLYYLADSDEERNSVVSTASLLVVGIFGVVTLTGHLTAPWISDALLGPDEPVLLVRLMVTSFVLGAIGDIPAVYLQARQRSSALVLSNVVKLVISLSLNIYFVVYLRTGVPGIFYSTIIAQSIVGGSMAVLMFRETGVRFVAKQARALVSFGSPLIASQLGSFVLHFSDRYFLRFFHPLSVVGIYALSYKFAMFIAMAVDGPFHSIWSAKALEIAGREGDDAPPILRSILLQYRVVVVTAALGASLFATDAIHLLLGEEFHSADRPVPLLALAIVFFCFRHVSQTGAMIAIRPGYIAAVTSGAAVTAILLNLLLIPRWGAMGAAAATAGAFGTEFLIMRALSERVYRIGLTVRAVLSPLAIAAVAWLSAAALIPSDAHPLVGFLLRLAAFGLYLAALFATGILKDSAREMIVRSMRNPRAILQALREA
jgi:O-antigen/teichoic acid export membrane protein